MKFYKEFIVSWAPSATNIKIPTQYSAFTLILKVKPQYINLPVFPLLHIQNPSTSLHFICCTFQPSSLPKFILTERTRESAGNLQIRNVVR